MRGKEDVYRYFQVQGGPMADQLFLVFTLPIDSAGI